MIEKSPTLVRLLQQLQQLPYLASKNLYRVATHLLTMEEDKVKQLCAVILEAKHKIIPCSRCFVWQELDQDCGYCSSSKRDQSTICVVETWHELMAIEKTGSYKGAYHILGGALSPLDGIDADDLHIKELVVRVDDTIKEVILATNQTPEGEATATYIAHKLKDKPILITGLARGVPVGASLEYIDRVTVCKALTERRPLL